MYGSATTPGFIGGTLASTGLGIGSSILLVVGIVFIGLGIWALVKKNSVHRP